MRQVPLAYPGLGVGIGVAAGAGVDDAVGLPGHRFQLGCVQYPKCRET
jgi:hypothetical protein